VASLGTALTTEHCRLIARYAERVYLCYDSDRAGREATKKAIRLLQETGIKIRVMTLSGKTADGQEIKDPDDFIRTFGKGAFEKQMAEAPGAIEYLFSQVRSRNELDTMDGKNAFIKECIELLKDVANPIESELYIHRISDMTGIPAEVVRAQTAKATGKEIRRVQKEALEKELKKTQGLGNKINPDKAKFLSSATKEENILGILLLRPEYLLDTKIRPKLDPELFRCAFCQKVLKELLRLTENDEALILPSLNETLSPEEIGELEGMKKKREELAGNDPAILLELIHRLNEDAQKEKNKQEPLSAEWLKKLKEEKSRKES
jgi:DNA primase